ncbi:MAG: hypothetical protein IH899_00075 [Planctomycetes bacterium]|nr:hypothetical protein [Planctomycetota bacterium]
MSRPYIGTCCAAVVFFIPGCDAQPGSAVSPAAGGAPELPATVEVAYASARNMRLVGYHDLQARSAYQPIVHAYGDRRILFVGQHAGEAMNPKTGVVEVNGMSILDVTDPSITALTLDQGGRRAAAALTDYRIAFQSPSRRRRLMHVGVVHFVCAARGQTLLRIFNL